MSKRHMTGRGVSAGLRRAGTALGLLCSAWVSAPAQAVDVDAGDYVPLPDGANLALLYYQYATRDSLYVDGDKQPLEAGLDSNVGILRGVHYVDVGGFIVDPQFLLPFGELKAKDDLAALGSDSGLGDLILAATVWVINDPEHRRYLGLTPFLFLPTGSYDKDQGVNLGENRWKLALQAGYVAGLGERFTLDLIGDVTFYGKNDELGPSEQTLKQDASFQLQGFLRYALKPTVDLRGGLSYSFGGETEVDDVKQDNELGTLKAQFGTAWFPTPTVQLMALYGRDLDVENGFREDHRINLRVLKVF